MTLSSPQPGPTRSRSSFVDRLITGGIFLAGLVLLYLLLSMVAGIVSRAALGRPMAWVIELSGPALVALTFLAAAAVAREDAHVRLAIIDEYISGRVLSRLTRVSTLIELLVIGGLLYATSIQWWADFQSGTLAEGFLRIERWRVTAFVPVGAALYILFLLRAFVRGRHIGHETGDTESSGAGP